MARQKQKRYPLLLDTEYPPERRVLDEINSVPEGERAGFVRVLIQLGHEEIEKQQRPDPAAEGQV
jgi:hypothetical protein